MKRIFLILLIPIFLFVIFSTNNQSKDTQVIITIPDLSSEDLFYLNNEFKRHSSLDFIDGSIESNTIALNVNVNSFNQTKVENLLNKWNCQAVNFDYNNLSDIADIE